MPINKALSAILYWKIFEFQAQNGGGIKWLRWYSQCIYTSLTIAHRKRISRRVSTEPHR